MVDCKDTPYLIYHALYTLLYKVEQNKIMEHVHDVHMFDQIN